MDEKLYRTIRLIRRFEERSIQLVRSGDIVGGIHPYIGQEAIAAGVCAALHDDDIIMSTHRGHGHVLAKGADPARMLAELCGKATGLNHGRGGSMHAADFSKGIFGANAIVGANASMATGAAWASLRQGKDRIAVSFFGDGAVSQGVFLEALNLAKLWQAPVLFVCENNGYATTQPVDETVAGTITGRASAFGIPSSTVDGMDARAVYEAAMAARSQLPFFLECTTYRFDVHHTWEYKAGVKYRSPESVTAGRSRDPMTIAGERLSTSDREAIDDEIETTLDAAVKFALDSPKPDPSTALDYLYASPVLS